jgi:hypothetical protein
MPTWFEVVVTGMGLGRIALGVAPFVAAGPAAQLVGFPAAHDTPTARLMGRLFGVRDIGLGVLVLWGLRNPAALPFVLLFNAMMDAGDLSAALAPLVRRQGIDRAAITTALLATLGGLGWLTTWLIAR